MQEGHRGADRVGSRRACLVHALQISPSDSGGRRHGVLPSRQDGLTGAVMSRALPRRNPGRRTGAPRSPSCSRTGKRADGAAGRRASSPLQRSHCHRLLHRKCRPR
jgi:hypothetical protein